MAVKLFSKKISEARKKGNELMKDAKIGSELVKISDQISSGKYPEGLLVKIADKYYRIKELG